jgi:hypothetical protein
VGSATEEVRRRRGRPRLHPDGLTERLSISVTRFAAERLRRLARLRRISLATLVRERACRDL